MQQAASVRLRVRNLHKSYAAKVLDGVSLDMGAGEIHGLVGENGAGKSTLFRILCGLTPADQGHMLIDDAPYQPRDVGEAIRAGVSLCAQELSLIDTLTVAENINLRALPGRWRLDRSTLLADTETILAELGINLSPRAPVASLSLAQRQMVEIAKALNLRARILVLDEPTSALNEKEAYDLHQCLRARAAAGTSILYVSHRLEDVLSVCDHVWVLRDGCIAHHGDSKNLQVAELIQHMSGSELQASTADAEPATGAIHLAAEHLTTAQLPQPLSIHCRHGEILGLAGLMGAGKTEVLEALYGLAPRTGGRITLTRDNDVIELEGVQAATSAGVGLVPENRATHGVLNGLSVAFNTVIADLGRIANHVLLSRGKERQAVTSLVERLQIKCQGADQPIDALSGGNQQKVLLARWLHNQCSLFLLDEPTRGVDVRSKLAIHDLLRALKAQGAAIIVASSELEELMSLCDRIVVLADRQIAAETQRGAYSKDAILAAAFSGHTRSVSA